MTENGLEYFRSCFVQLLQDKKIAEATDAPWVYQARDAVNKRVLQLQGMLELAKIEGFPVNGEQKIIDSFFSEAKATAKANSTTEWAEGESHESACDRLYEWRERATNLNNNQGDFGSNGNNGKSSRSVQDLLA